MRPKPKPTAAREMIAPRSILMLFEEANTASQMADRYTRASTKAYAEAWTEVQAMFPDAPEGGTLNFDARTSTISWKPKGETK